jgi:hypothetical protein
LENGGELELVDVFELKPSVRVEVSTLFDAELEQFGF